MFIYVHLIVIKTRRGSPVVSRPTSNLLKQAMSAICVVFHQIHPNDKKSAAKKIT